MLKVGDFARVVGPSCAGNEEYNDLRKIGTVVKIFNVDDVETRYPYLAMVDGSADCCWWPESSLALLDPPEEIQAHGVTYIRKPEPKHVWGFGQWARTPSGEVAFVLEEEDESGVRIYFKDSRYMEIFPASDLTYISTAEIPE